MVAKATEASLLCSVDEFILPQRHEVEMLNAFLVVLHHATAKGRLVDHLSHILVDELVLVEVRVRAQAVALLLRLDNGYIGVEFPLEALVLAEIAAAT